MSSILLVAVVLVGALGVLNLALVLAVIRRLRTLPTGSAPDGAGLPPGTPLPEFQATGHDGAPVTGAMFAGGGFLAFMRVNCPWCWDKLPAMTDYLAGTDPAHVLFVVVEDDELSDERRQALAALGTLVFEKPGGPLLDRFEVRGTPSYVLVGADGTVRAWTTDTAELPHHGSLAGAGR
ncbi:MAG: redoxin domain-containing protein [Streptomyces sp.]|nr:redoxin domain-containing protein [Streptomyces sp.]